MILDARIRARLTRWVSGGELPPSRQVEQEEVTLIPDKETYQPGDTARILVQSPFSPAEGLLTVARNGILYTERFTIEESTTTLLIPITEAHYPNLHIQVDLTGSAPRTTEFGEMVEGVPPRPAFATGTLNLNVPPFGRTLEIEVTPRQSELAPGESTTLDITVKDANGEPVSGAELAVVVVDEAILALTNYQVCRSALSLLLHPPANLQSRYGRSSIILVDPASSRPKPRMPMACCPWPPRPSATCAHWAVEVDRRYGYGGCRCPNGSHGRTNGRSRRFWHGRCRRCPYSHRYPHQL